MTRPFFLSRRLDLGPGRQQASRLTAACAIGVLGLASAASAAPPPPGSTYVAMGSSFAAGPGIAELVESAPARCGQSSENYPRQLARALKLSLADRSCSGAVTADLIGVGPLGLPPQSEALTPDTALVTVTIAGNDIRWTADFNRAACLRHAEALPEASRAAACPAPADFSLEDGFRTAEAGLRGIAAAVRARSPRARLIFVDYVTILPPDGTCAALAISAPAAAELRDHARRLSDLTERVARETGAELVKASDLTRAHDPCAPDPWAAGLATAPGPTGRPVASFHPLLAAHTAIAAARAAKLRD